MKIIGWRRIDSNEALEIGLPVRGAWERWGIHLFGWSISFICRDVSESGEGIAQYRRNEARR